MAVEVPSAREGGHSGRKPGRDREEGAVSPERALLVQRDAGKGGGPGDRQV